VWGRAYQTEVREGYEKNSVGFHAINKIATKCGEIPLKLWRREGDKVTEVKQHPVLKLLQRPNDVQKHYATFVETWVSYLKLDGNSYIYNPANTKFPREMLLPQPDQVEPKTDPFGVPTAYKVKFGNHEVKVDDINQINHTKTFNPFDNRKGMSPLLGRVVVEAFL